MSRNTVPATADNLKLQTDHHKMAGDLTGPLSDPHAVIVDGIQGVASVGYLDSLSLRIDIRLDDSHPDLGTNFTTKYFQFVEDGVVQWGHDGKSFQIQKVIQGE